MNGVNWIQVLEIETFLNNLMNQNPLSFQIKIWEEGKKHNMLLNKNQSYYSNDIKEYLFKKYPNNDFFRKSEELIDQLIVSIINGNRHCEVDQELYELNLNPQSLQTTTTEQRLKFIEAYNQRIGVDIYWYNILKEIIQSQSQFNKQKIIEDFLGYVDINIKKEFAFSIIDLDPNILPENWEVKTKDLSQNINLFSKLDIVKKRILNYRDNSTFTVFQKMCKSNDYTFYYENVEPTIILKDSIAFSISICLNRVLNESNKLFGYDLRKTTSLYPQSLISHPYKTLAIYITPFGFFEFERINELFENDELEKSIKNYLSEKYEIVNKTAIVDNEDWISEFNRFNSSFIIGENLEYRTFWGRRTKQFVDKLISGTFWFNDDIHGTILGFIGLHPETALEGEQKYSIPAKNVLYYYSELRLEKMTWGRELRDIHEAGYRNDIEEEEDDEDSF